MKTLKINQKSTKESIKAFKFFSACFCKNIDHPNVADINSFIVWLDGKFSYATGTIKNCIGVIKMFYKEKGYELTDFAKAKLKQAYKKIKNNTLIRYKELEKILLLMKTLIL